MASNYNNGLYNDYQNEVNKNKTLENKYKLLKLKYEVAESENQRLEKVISDHEKIIGEKDKEIEAYKKKIIELSKKLDITSYERDNYLSKLKIDGTNSGLPTSQTPINKKKIIPNSRKNTGGKIGGKLGHKKNKLNTFEIDEANEHIDITLSECPNCHCKDLKLLDSETIKEELDYEIKVIKRCNHYKEYKCSNCNKIVKKTVPSHLKEDIQYGSNVQATALTLMNIGNVPINKVRRIISGLTFNEIVLSEGFISKLQQRAASKLETFIKDLKYYIIHLNIVYWDDTVIMVNKNRSCMRFYGNEDVALYCAHQHKGKEGLDKDNILKLLPEKTVVEHDHNKVNYNDDYSFINSECCQHLLRDLQKVSTNIPDRTWAKKLKELFQEYDHKRKKLIEEKKDCLSTEDFDNFLSKINEYLMLGIEENIADPNVYYAGDEATLLIRLIEYRDNYIYWTLDFNIPFTNNLSERALRGIKSKMKVAGQFQNIQSAEYYGILRSYIETCHRNNVNEHDSLNRLIQGNPYTLEEILKNKKESE